MRQLGRPALLAASYKGDTAGIAAAAVEEVEGTLANCLHELERLALASGGRCRPGGGLATEHVKIVCSCTGPS